MRHVFIVIAKLIGLFQIYWSLTWTCSLFMLYGQMTAIESVAMRQISMWSATVLGCATLLGFGLGWMLLVKTTWLADKLKIPADAPLPAVSDDAVLRVGVKLIGIYFLARAIPEIVGGTVSVNSYGYMAGGIPAVWIKLVPVALTLVIALLLTIRTDSVLGLIHRGEKVGGKRIVMISVVILAILMLLGRGLSMRQWGRTDVSCEADSVCESDSAEDQVIAVKDTNAASAYTRALTPFSKPETNSIPLHLQKLKIPRDLNSQVGGAGVSRNTDGVTGREAKKIGL